MKDQEQTKAAVSVTEMSLMVGLSRARFWQLVQAGVFPRPERDAESGRPFYGEELQRACLEVRRRNCGINGKPVLFYARRLPSSTPAARPRKMRARPGPKTDQNAGLVDAVKALGLKAVTPNQVAAAVAEEYPSGTAGMDEGEVIRAVFMRLKRQNAVDSVGR
jgi:hypothetical protein